MIVFGLDLSLSAAGVAVLTSGKLTYSETIVFQAARAELIKTKSGKSKTLSERLRIERLIAIRDRISDLVVQYQPEAVAIEGYAFAKFSSSVTGLAELGGVVRVMLLERHGLISATLPVTQCRAFVVGKGSAKKGDVQEFLHGTGLVFDSDDEGDAFVVAMAMAYAVEPGLRAALPLGQLEALDSILRTVDRLA